MVRNIENDMLINYWNHIQAPPVQLKSGIVFATNILLSSKTKTITHLLFYFNTYLLTSYSSNLFSIFSLHILYRFVGFLTNNSIKVFSMSVAKGYFFYTSLL